MRKLGPNLARAASETAIRLLQRARFPRPAWEAPRIQERGRIQCSQKNVGDKYQMICNLTADKSGWDRLFPGGVDDTIRMDAYCELANCICGELLADPAFADWFGYLIPCVPCSGPGCMDEGTYSVNGALRLNGSWILFSFAVHEVVSEGTGNLTAAA